MASFDPASLSPRAIKAEAFGLPFGLTWRDLAPALPGLSGGRTRECVLTRRFELQGLRDRMGSTPVTVRYPLAGGFETVDLFVKRTSALEARWYRLLAAHDVPLPALHSEVKRDDCVVIVLEFLDTIGVRFDAPADIAEMLQLVSRLNSIAVGELDDRYTYPPGLPEAEFTAKVQEALDSLTQTAALAHLNIVAHTWLGAYLETKDQCTRMPTAVTHGEFYFQQVGRRSDGALVMFDLATIAVRPRFSDISSILAPMAERTAVAEHDLLSEYLGSLAALGTESPQIEEAFTELRVLRSNRTFQSLPWLVRAHDDPDIGFGVLAERVATLHRDLRDLGLV